ncbi:MAG TPA: glycosyltransferase family 4 protein [Steroidobacteraceae bacterium]|nr:glycosyltransferase family 4 protein [Steroidobacteraceae bacterium]
MRILFCTHVFAPSVGGIETVSAMLAEEFVRQGHEVELVTQTAGDAMRGEGYRIHRRPGLRQLLRLLRWCEVCFHNNISLRTAWPLLLLPRPWVVAHHTWIPHAGLAGRVKRLALRRARGIAPSRALAGHLDTPVTVIPNPYDEGRFGPREGVRRERDMVFVGRLVSDKGCGQLLDALQILFARGLHPTLTIIGSGPEAGTLAEQASRLGLAARVEFTGVLHGENLVAALNRHRILVVPSRWEEPFGVVALEGVACGCVVVGSDGGGLPDAMGPCGLAYERGNAQALADSLERMLRDDSLRARLRDAAPGHLATHHRPAVAARYLRVLGEAAGGRRGG